MRAPLIRRLVRVAAVSSAAALASAGLTAGAASATPHGGFAPANRPATLTQLEAARVGGHNIDGGNWGGYVVKGSNFTSVSASWVQPKATCTSSRDLYAPWVGIDGYGSRSVEQTGVATDCQSGTSKNEPWYEMYPAEPVYLDTTKYPVDFGDTITATVTAQGGNSYKLDLSNNTKGWNFTTTQSLNAERASAEAIIESPPGAYPNFGTVKFSSVTVNGKSFDSFNPTALDPSAGGVKEATAGPLSGGSFEMQYNHE